MKIVYRVLAAVLLASPAAALPYFRVLDASNLQKSAGVYIDPKDASNSSAGTAVALISHSVRDGGCLLPSIVCEDWSLLAAGFSVHAGRLDFNVGPSMNLTPLAKAGALSTLNLLTPEDSLSGLKSSLSSDPLKAPSLSVAFGPALQVSPIVNGVFVSPDKLQGRFRVFVGAAWSFK